MNFMYPDIPAVDLSAYGNQGQQRRSAMMNAIQNTMNQPAQNTGKTGFEPIMSAAMHKLQNKAPEDNRNSWEWSADVISGPASPAYNGLFPALPKENKSPFNSLF